jgi:hypothetical protein
MDFKSGFMSIKTYIEFSTEVYVLQDNGDFIRFSRGEAPPTTPSEE